MVIRYFYLLFVSSCTSQEVVYKDFISEWNYLSQEDGAAIIFEPCDGGPSGLIIKESKIVQLLSQDAVSFSIESHIIKEGILTTKVNYEGNKGTMVIERIDAHTLLFESEKLGLTPHFKKVKQPCEECWDDCEN